jgi:hypothetical protein
MSEARIERLAFQREDAEGGLVDAVERAAVHESFEGFDPEGELDRKAAAPRPNESSAAKIGARASRYDA